MSKAMIAADIHIHSHKENIDRLSHGLEALRWIFTEAERNECKYLLFLGDLFHEKSKIDVLNYLSTFEIFLDFFVEKKSTINAFLLCGNHDAYLKEKWDVNSIKPLSAINNVHIVDKPSTINLDGVNIDFCPYTANPIQHLQQLKEGRPKEDLRLLLGHLSVHGAILNKLYGTRADVIVEYDTDMVPVSADLFNDWDMTILGHYHAAQHLNDKAEYLGSPYQISFGESFQDKHILVLDLETMEKQYVKNDFSPRHYIIPSSEEDVYDLNGHFVRVLMDDMGAKDLLETRTRIMSKYKMASFDFKESDKKPDQDIEMVEEAKILTDNHEDTMRSFVANAVLPPEITDRDLLFKEGLGICRRVS
jgi:DNA repair exonuclease SbcCD nuclease subunit